MTAPSHFAVLASTRPTASAQILRFLVRFLVCSAALSILAYRYGVSLTELLLAAFRSEINWLDDTYRIDRLFVDTEGADQVVRIVVGLARCIVLEGRAYCGDPRGMANASTLLGNVTVPAVWMVAVALAWPVLQARDYMLRLLAVAPALAVMWAVDVPFVLWAALWTLHVDAFAPNVFSPLLIWSEFLQSGGRLALASVLGALVANVPNTLRVWQHRSSSVATADKPSSTTKIKGIKA